jgi:hypothetical protein
MADFSASGVRTNISLVLYIQFKCYCTGYVGRDSSVGIGARYGLDGPGIDSRWGARFSAPVQIGPGVHIASCTRDAGYLPGVKQRCVALTTHPPTSSAEVKERVELNLYSPSGPSWPRPRVNFTFIYLYRTWYRPLLTYCSVHSGRSKNTAISYVFISYEMNIYNLTRHLND